MIVNFASNTMVVIQVANTGSFMTAVPRGVMQVADNIETKKLA
ncbi:MAG: hypothetical protein ACEY3L_01030 [Wolbachia sp.]